MSRHAALLAAALAVFGLAAEAQGQSTKDTAKPAAKAKTKAAPAYKKATIQGFTLMINQEVYRHNDDPRWKRKPLDVLDLELGTIVRRLPERYVKALRRITLWIEWEDTDDPDFDRGVVAKYYGVMSNVALWSLSKTKHPGKANNIEVINMRSLTREHQPGVKLERCVLLHELAHAVHFQVLGPNNAAIKATYQQAMKRGLYDEAVDVYGRTRKRPYASSNEKEYFAELTCAYLDKLHYFPFNADDLKKHDPQGYKLMEKIWGTRKQLDATIKAQAEKAGAAAVAAAERLYRAGKKEAAVEALEKAVKAHAATKAAEGAKKLLAAWREAEKKEAKKDDE